MFMTMRKTMLCSCVSFEFPSLLKVGPLQSTLPLNDPPNKRPLIDYYPF